MTVEAKDLAKAEIEFLSDKCEKLEQENQQLRKWCEEFNALEVAEENKRLKGLLLSSRGFVDKERITLETSGFGHNEYCRRTKELLTAIDNAIGEK
jgi:hypothetical protein